MLRQKSAHAGGKVECSVDILCFCKRMDMMDALRDVGGARARNWDDFSSCVCGEKV